MSLAWIISSALFSKLCLRISLPYEEMKEKYNETMDTISIAISSISIYLYIDIIFEKGTYNIPVHKWDKNFPSHA